MNAELVAVATRYFTTLDQEPEAHLATFSRQALVVAGTRAVPHAEAHPGDYAAVLAQLRELRGGGPPPGWLTRPRVTEIQEAGAEAVVRVVDEELPGQVALAMVLEDGWKVLVALPVGPDPLPSFPLVVARGLAEVAVIGPLRAAGDLAADALELAARRSLAPLDMPLLALPDSRFACHHSGRCCSPEWGIQLDEHATRALSAMPLARLAPELSPEPLDVLEDGTAHPANVDGRCAFHQGDRCVLHGELGWVPIRPCFSFPMVFTATPEGLCVSGSFVCPSVQGNLGPPYAERELDFRRRARMTADWLAMAPARVSLTGGEAELAWADYRTLEAAWLTVLADATLPLGARLARGEGMLRALLAGAPLEQALCAPAAIATPGEPLELEPEGVGLFTLLARQFPAIWDELPGLSPTERMQLPARLGPTRLVGAEELLTRYARALLWRKVHLADAGLAYQWRVGMLQILLAADVARVLAASRGLAATGPQELDDGVRAVEVAGLHADHLRRVLKEHPLMRACFLEPGWADHLLARVRAELG